MTSPPTAIMSKGSGLISAQDLLKLMKSGGKSSFLRVKTYGTFTKAIKWKQRFVILANNEIYVYENEMSKKASDCIPLLGYNRVRRFQNDKFPWSFSIVAAVSSVKTRVFSCSTEDERREWMRKVKEHLYKANDVERSLTDALNQLTFGTEQEYLDLEEAVFSTNDGGGDDLDHDDRDLDLQDKKDFSGDDSDDSEVEDLPVVKRPGRKMSVGSVNSDRELPPIPFQPPRYSQVIDDMKKKLHTYQNDPEYSGEPEENLSTAKLEACLITDPALEKNREKCIQLLRTKTHLGTHLLRKSRQDDNLVLVVLTENSDIKEYRLEERGSMFRLAARTGEAEFISLDALLRFFSHNAILPGLKHYLSYGVFEMVDGDVYSEMAS